METTDDRLLARLLGGTDQLEDFLENYWGKKPYISRGAIERFHPEFKLTASDYLHTLIKTPTRRQEGANQVRLFTGLRFAYQKPPFTDGDEMAIDWPADRAQLRASLNVLERGGGLEAQGFDTLSDKLRIARLKLSREIGSVRGAPNIDVMLTSRFNEVARHMDPTSTMTLQLEGKKRWRVSRLPAFDKPITFPYVPDEGEDGFRPNATRGQLKDWERRAFDKSMEDPENLIEFDIEPGDLLYIPTGTWHDTKTLTDHSLAFLIQFFSYPMVGYISRFLEALLETRANWRDTPRLPETAFDKDGHYDLQGAGEHFLTYLKEIRDGLNEVLEDDATRGQLGYMIRDIYTESIEQLDDQEDFIDRANIASALEHLGKPVWEPLTPETRLALQTWARALLMKEERDGQNVLVLYHGDSELAFEDERFFPLARFLANAAGGFTVAEAHASCAEHCSMEEVIDRLNPLLDELVLVVEN